MSAKKTTSKKAVKSQAPAPDFGGLLSQAEIQKLAKEAVKRNLAREVESYLNQVIEAEVRKALNTKEFTEKLRSEIQDYILKNWFNSKRFKDSYRVDRIMEEVISNVEDVVVKHVSDELKELYESRRDS